MPKPRGKRSRQKIAPDSVAPRESNGGLLLTGNPGNSGGAGRPPSAIRLLCRHSFEARIPILEQIADGEAVVKIKVKGDEGESVAFISAEPKDRIRAIDLLGKYGGIEKITVEARDARPEEPGEDTMARIHGLMGRVLRLAPEARRLQLLRELEGAAP